MMRRLVFAVLSLTLLAAPCALAQQLVNVFVQSDNNGFSAAGATDSALDLQKSLRNKKSLRVVDSPSEADVIVRIDSRDQRKEVDGYTTNRNTSDHGRSSTKTTTANDKTIRALHATLMAGDYTQALDAESDMSWRFAADNIAGQVERWTKQNYSRLMAVRTSGGNGAPQSPPASTQTSSPPPHSDPAAGADANIQPGMTTDQVTKALGEPQKKVNFGTKSLWTYKGMQVVFESGKVTDVKF
jgi:outer membrane protein assembly factor BamE (lipoprotein component of BamABCDE complex)